MDLGTFREDGGRERRQEKRHWTGQQSSPNKRQAVDPGRVQVEIVCEKYGVGAKWQFSANHLREDLCRVKVPGWSNGLGWNVESKMYIAGHLFLFF